MAQYSTDERDAAQDDLDIAATIRDSLETWLTSQLRHKANLNKNSDEIDAMITQIRDAFGDTVGCIISMTKAAGAEETRPEYRAADLHQQVAA